MERASKKRIDEIRETTVTYDHQDWIRDDLDVLLAEIDALEEELQKVKKNESH